MGILVNSCWFAAPTCAEPITIRINSKITHQVMDGFGASGAWWAQHVGAWPEEEVDRIVDLLYGPRGAALSIYRFNLGAGGAEEIHDPWRRTESFEKEPGQYDWSRDGHAVNVLRKVRDRGVDQFVFFANSPPIRLTRTGMASGGDEGGSNLKPGAEAEFSKYLVDIADHWRKELHLAYVTVSPLNEPQWRWGGDGRGQEGSHYSPLEAARLLRSVAEEIAARKAPLHLEGPEAARWGNETPEYLDAVLDDPVLATRLHRLAIHSYFSDAREKAATIKHLRKRKIFPPIAVTEWCEMQRGRDVTMRSALTMAKVLHEDLTIADVASWQAWIAVSRYDYKDGLIYVDPETRAVSPTKRLWVMGQFSRFVRMGFVRLEANTDDPSLHVTAFRSPASDQVVLVIVNAENEAQEATLTWEDDECRPTLEDVYVTSATVDLAPVDHAAGPLQLAPESVTTIRLFRDALPQRPHRRARAEQRPVHARAPRPATPGRRAVRARAAGCARPAPA